jgi:hypothetical protein
MPSRRRSAASSAARCCVALAAQLAASGSPVDGWRCDGDAQSASPTRLQLHSLAEVDELAVCNDGTAAAYYLRPNPSSSLWLFYLAGGAWCSSPEDCEARWEGAVYPNNDCRLPPGQQEQLCFMSNKDFPEECSKAGIFDASPNNPLADANLVYLPYCSSDAFLGDRPASPTVPWHFRGQHIIRGALQALVDTHGLGAQEETTLLFGGGSAGARGAMAWLDLVPDLVPDSVRVVGFLDSPYVIDEPPLGSSGFEPDFAEQVPIERYLWIFFLNEQTPLDDCLPQRINCNLQ